MDVETRYIFILFLFLSTARGQACPEDFAKSKPDPDCYLKGAACFDAKPEKCVGLEDSFNGLKAVRAAGAFTLGLSTTNSKESIEPYSDYVIADYSGFTFADLVKVVEENKKQ